MFHRLAHLSQIKIAKGDLVKRGDLIGNVGSTGNSSSPHLHFDCPFVLGGNLLQYTEGLDLETVRRRYADPTPFITNKIPCDYEYSGYKYLEWTGTLFHSGIDINSLWDDGKPVYSPVNGEVIFSGEAGKWGNLIVIKQTMETIKINISQHPNIDPRILFITRDFYLRNGFELDFKDGEFDEGVVDTFAYIVPKINPQYLPTGTCSQTIPYQIKFTADPNNIEYSAQVLIHELAHSLFFAALLGDIHAYGWGQADNQAVVDYLNSNLISDKKNTMIYIIDEKHNQFLLYPTLKIAYTISNPTDLGKLKVRGLLGNPIQQEVPSDYLIFAAAGQQEIRELFNL